MAPQLQIKDDGGQARWSRARAEGYSLTRRDPDSLMQCSIQIPRCMKLFAFWLLVVLAVLVPATAVIASATTAPTSAELRQHVAQGVSASKHAAASGLHAKVAKAKAKVRSDKAVGADQQADHCCDLTPCSQCAGCGTCPAMATNASSGTDARPLALSLLPESRGPRAEFLLSGQERPPRAS